MNKDCDNLKALVARRNQLLRERDKLPRCEEKKDTTYSNNSDTSCSVVECSDGELEKKVYYFTAIRKNKNVTINSSTDEEYISTSTVQFPKDHAYFTRKNSVENALNSPDSDKNQKNIQILSNIKVNVEADKENHVFVTSKDDQTIKYTISLENQQPNLQAKGLQQKILTKKQQKIDSPIISEESPPTYQQLGSPTISFQSGTGNETTTYADSLTKQKFTSPSIINQKDWDDQTLQLPSTSNYDNYNNNEVNKTRKRKRETKFNKSYLDFMSDDGDFSSGSSDIWKKGENDTGSSSDENEVKKKKRKRSSKERNTENPSTSENIDLAKKKRKVNKRKQRKQLRDRGAAYQTSTGVTKEARQLRDNPCVIEKCPRKCYEISEERRQAIFDYFWNLDNQRKKDWLIFHSKTSEVKRKKTKTDKSRRARTHQYSINEGEGRRMVCQQFLLKTLDISQKLLLYTLKNEENDGLAKVEQRKSNVPPKYDDETKESANLFFQNLPAVPSHYCRANSKRLYLPQELKNVTNLHTIYKKERVKQNKPFLSERLFINMFHTDFNYSFHVPKKDKCNLCTQFENNPGEVNNTKLTKHLEDKEDMEGRFKYHQQLRVPRNKTVVASFDLQKVLNTPHGESMLLYYSRKYAVYCFTVYESITQNGYCYVWGESDAKRGSNDIGSCLYKYLKTVDNRGVKKLILYCDSCAGQNKNKTILSMLRYFLTISINLETIQINYLLPGHTYMPVDSMHAIIEREVRKLIVWAPSQWPTFIESARKYPRPYQVEVMEHTDFLNFDGVLFTTDVALRMRQIKIVTLKKKDKNTITVKYSMSPDSQTVVININTESTGMGNKENGKKRKTTKENEVFEHAFASTRTRDKSGKSIKKGEKDEGTEETKRVSKSNKDQISEKGKGIGKKTKIKKEFNTKPLSSTKAQFGKGKGRGKNTKGKEELKRASTSHSDLPGKEKGKGRGKNTEEFEQPSTSKIEQPSTSKIEQPSTSKIEQPSTSKNEQPSTSKTKQPSTSNIEQPGLKPLYKEKLKIAYQKYIDLKKLCDNGSIPRRFQSEYLSLPYSKKIMATLAETDEEDDDEEDIND